MDTARCPACNAAVAPRAAWCTLCYADLSPRPAAAPVLAPTVVPVAEPHVDPHDPLGLGGPVAAIVGPTLLATIAEPTWPCTICAATMPMDSPLCTECGAAFLAGSDPALSLVVPGVGDLATASTGVRALAGIAAAVVLALVFLVLAFVGGKIF